MLAFSLPAADGDKVWNTVDSGLERGLTASNGTNFVGILADQAVHPYSYSYVSSDGINWTKHFISTTIPAGSIQSLVYGNAKFVGVPNGTYGITSSDGATWQIYTMPATGPWVSLTFGNGIFVASLLNSNKYATSADGSNWTLRTLPITASFINVAYGNGKFVAISFAGDVLISTTGTSWTVSIGILPVTFALTYGNGRFVATTTTRINDTIYENGASVSTDGITWSQNVLPLNARFKIAFCNSKFIAVSDQTRDTLVSSDGENWTTYKLPLIEAWGVPLVVGSNAYLISNYKLCSLPV